MTKSTSTGPPQTKTRHGKLPRLRTVLTLINCLLLLVPVALISSFSIYENERIRRTEAELIGQAAFVAASYKANIERLLTAEINSDHPPRHGFGLPCAQRCVDFEPRQSSLSRATHEILPSAPEFEPIQTAPSTIAQTAGSALSSQLEEATQLTLSNIFIASPSGVIVGASRDNMIGKGVTNWVEFQEALLGTPTSTLRTRVPGTRPCDSCGAPVKVRSEFCSQCGTSNGLSLSTLSRSTHYRVFVSLPVIVDQHVVGVVVGSRTPLQAAKAFYWERRALVIAAIISLLTVAFVAFFTSRTISRPMAILVKQATDLEEGKQIRLTPVDNPRIKEVKELSDAMVAVSNTLRQRANYVETFANNVSHGFKTPLTSIRGTIELLRDHAGTMSPEQQAKFISNLDTDSSRLHRLVTRLLSLAQSGSGNQSKTAPYNPSSRIESILEPYQTKGLCITTKLADSVWVSLEPDGLAIIVENLLDNAIKYGGDGVSVTLTLTTDDEQVQLVVSDDGPGWPKELADPFAAFSTTSADTGGTGLGLAIVQTMVETFHGQVIATDNEQGGASVIISLPKA
jgi:signal transduction histidine kinase